MPNLSQIVQSLHSQPAYTLMRGAARFGAIRSAVGLARTLWQRRALASFLAACASRASDSPFAAVDREEFVRRLDSDGLAVGLMLPPQATREIGHYATQHPCYADRDPACGFRFGDRAVAERRLGKPILVAQYFNAAQGCAAIARLAVDPVLTWIAGRYLDSIPTFVGANLWWTFPVRASEADRDRHAHLFHRDVDDFKFFKFFFYLSNVQPGDGAHVCVAASHRRPPIIRLADRWNIRRYSDAEIGQCFASERVVELCGPAGTGFAENTLCVHKGLTPTKEPRLLLQLQYALFDYGVMHDDRSPTMLRLIT
jgi:hypothetical protein